MIRVLSNCSHDAALIAEAVGWAGNVVNQAGSLTPDSANVECVVVGCRSPLPLKQLELVRAIAEELPWTPIIVVTDPTPAAATWLGESSVSDIVWFDDMKTEIRPRIEAALSTSVLSRVADEIQRSPLSPRLRTALVHSLRACTDRPVRNVKQLADLLRCSPVTLSHAFRSPQRGGATLGRFLGALMILRAHQLRTSGLSWEAVAQHLGYTRPTLHRKSTRWPGRTLKGLTEVPRQQLLAKLVSDFVQPLLENARGTARGAP